MRQFAGRERADTGRKGRASATPQAAEGPVRVRLRRKLAGGDRYRKADRRCDEVAELRLREGVQEILRWLRTA